MANDSCDDPTWESFLPDAARTIRASQGFEEAVAQTLDRPFDAGSHVQVEVALEELRAAIPAATRIAHLDPFAGV